MQPITAYFFVLPFSCGLLGLLAGVILISINRGNLLAARLLAGILTAISIPLIGNALYLTSFYLSYPYLYRLLSFAAFCIGPLAYLYVRSIVTQAFRLKKTDWLFFLPAILYQLHRLPFLFLSGEGKLRVVNAAMSEIKNIAAEPEGWLPPGWAALFRLMTGVTFIVFQFLLLKKWKEQLNLQPELKNKNAENIRWLNWFTYVLVFSYGLLLIETLLHIFTQVTLGTLIVLTICFSILFIAAYLFAKPVILYGMVGWNQLHEQELQKTEVTETDECKKISLSAEEGKRMKTIIESHLLNQKPYCRQGYGVHDLAKEVNIPLYQVSAFINQEYEKNFNDWINDHRFTYLTELMQQESNFHRYTLEALGKMAGFNSRTSFISAIKKRTGKTPSAYFKQEGKDSK
jgi:AraC-like DNA-binding protein